MDKILVFALKTYIFMWFLSLFAEGANEIVLFSEGTCVYVCVCVCVCVCVSESTVI